MKTIARLTLAAFAALALFAGSARAGDTVYSEVVWEPPNTTTTALASAILETGKYESLRVQVKPLVMAGGASRVTTITCHKTNSDEIFAFDAVTATTTSPADIVFDTRLYDPDDATTQRLPTGVTVIPLEPCRRMKFSIAAASGTVRALVTGVVRKR